MTECFWIMRIMIMLTDKGFLKAAKNSLSALRIASYFTCGRTIIHDFMLSFIQACCSISWIHHDVTIRVSRCKKKGLLSLTIPIFLPTLRLGTLFIAVHGTFLKCLYGPRALSERCQALIGEPVIFCCWTIDFYLHSYLLMDTKPVAVYWSSLQKLHWKETGQREEWGINLLN